MDIHLTKKTDVITSFGEKDFGPNRDHINGNVMIHLKVSAEDKSLSASACTACLRINI